MKIRLLTLLFALVAPMLVFGQTITGPGGAFTAPGTTSGVVTFPATASGIAGSTLAGGTCASTGVVIPDAAVPAILGYNTEITNITLFNAQHTFASDLDLRLIAPDGTVFTFIQDNGGSTGLDVAQDMCFDITSTACADTWLSSGSANQPADCLLFETSENVCGPFDSPFNFVCGTNTGLFDGIMVDGTWTLEVTDDAGGDTGSFDSFSVTFGPITPPTVDDMGTPIDLLACCVDVCNLTGPTEFNFPLEAGECEEAIFYDAPGIGGGPSCKFCGELPEATYVGVGNITETLGANGLPTTVIVGEGAGGNSYTITAVTGATLFFDWQFVGSTFWDPYTITGPSGTIVTNVLGSGSVAQPLLPGESVVASVNSTDNVMDGSSLTLSNIGFFNPADYPCYSLELISGPEVGSYQPVGCQEANYVATPFQIIGGSPTPDPGAAINYTQQICVLPYTGPISNALACNDQVNISVDENCSLTISADMFLEGGPYGCYDDYEVNIWIFGNEANQTGNVNGATIDFGNLLGTHTYEVTDPNTGNSCWGEFTAEDKLAPTLTCNDYTILCTEGTINSPLVCDALNGTFDVQTNSGGPNAYEFEFLCGAIIEDVNVNVDIAFTGSQFAWGATITTPNGAELSIWPVGIGGCGNLNFIADDQGPNGITCVQFTTGIPTSMIDVHQAFGFPYTPLAAANGFSSQGIWTLNLEGGLIVNDFSLIINGGECGQVGGTPDADACGNTSYTFSDNEVDNGCEGSVITRTWFATDASGNTSDGCVQTITIENIEIADILLPPALIVLPCGNGTSPEDIENFFDNPLTTDIPLSATCQLDVVERNEGIPFGWPHYNQRGCDGNKHPQRVDNSVCNIYADYTDQVIPACGPGCNGNVKVIRTWTLLDWCTQEIATYTQLIKSVDLDGPTFIVKDVTVSTDPWGCEANIDIPQPWELHDDCTDNLTYTVSGPAGVIIVGDAVNGYTALGAPKGVHTFTYTASDCCGNVTSVNATFTVVDATPPVAVAKQNIVISLTSSGTSNTGLAKLYAASVDNGSHDGCTDVKIEVRRDEDPCDIKGNATYNADGHPQDGSASPSAPNYDPDGGAYVKFCCEDITNAVVDVNGDGVNDPGYVKVWLRVWDDGDMDGIIGTPAPFGNDNYNETWTYVKVEDKLAPAIVCPPDVTLTCDMDYTDLNMTGSATGYASCGGIDVEYNDIIISLNACNEGFVRRRWQIVGRTDIFCDQTITLDDIDEPVNVSFAQVGDFTAANCPDMIALGQPTWVAGPCDVLGYTVETDTFKFEDGACYKLVNHWTVINWCDYEPNNPFWNGEGLWEHIQVIKVTDETKPVIEDCEDKMFAINDHSDSDNDGVVCEAKITLTNVATDEGSENCPTGWLKWQVRVDLWGDGTLDLEYSSFLPTFDTQFNDTNLNGIPDVYLAPTANGETVSIPLPDIAGSMSNHKVFWKVTDGCNNQTTCDYEFMVVDKKAPTPYCVSLSTAVMDMGPDGNPGVELWAEDFNVGSFDNCTAQENLLYSFSGTDYVPNRMFTCEDVANSPVEVQMYVWDEKGNNDFCTVFLTIVDNQELCDEGSRPDVAGIIETATGNAVVDVETTLDANFTEFPKVEMTDDNGYYAFASNPAGLNYEISASKDVDYLNGVSTLDLVKIQRHILGLESLDSPYKVIAADVNADNDVKASDLTQLRKLILGVITDLPTNESWRFVDGAQSLTMSTPLENVNYVIEINNLQVDMMDNNMVAVKVGDVTDNAVANFANQTTEVRSSKVLTLTIAEQEVTAGETVEVSFTSEDFADVYGYQFTMELNGLEFAGVQSGAVTMTDGNVGVLSNNIVTVSYSNSDARTAGNAEAVFTATFVATQNGNLSNMIDLTSKVTPAEAYVGQSLEIRDVAISTRGAITDVDASELFQNEPNPFRGQTVVGFNLAEAAAATITVFDVTGKVIVKENVNGIKGYNTVNFNANQLGTSGVLYYTLESGDFTATKKMIIIE